MSEDFFQSKKLTRDYQKYVDPFLPILNIMLARRSWRRYNEFPADKKLTDSIYEILELSAKVRECDPDSLKLITNEKQVNILKDVAYKGLMGKINPWLPRSKPTGLILQMMDKKAFSESRPVAFAYSSMVSQDIMLYLTELGFGSVWLGSINSREIAKSLDLPKEKWVSTMIAFGKTDKEPGGLNVDNLVYRQVSRKRKPLDSIVYQDYFEHKFDIPDTISDTIKVNPEMTIKDCIESLADWKENQVKEAPLSQLEWELLAESARIAPSASNIQPWKFILIKDKRLLKEIAAILGQKTILNGAVAALGTLEGWQNKTFEKPFWMIDLPIAMSHISLTATALSRKSKAFVNIPEEKINNQLKLKNEWRTVGIIGII